MKIGLLTFHNAHNYGAMLQCYALQQYLRKCGHLVDVIDYRPSFYRDQYRYRSLFQCLRWNIFHLLMGVYYNYILYNRRCSAFNDFLREYIHTTKETFVIPEHYDAYIVGSDQIWNPVITNGFHDVYFCKFFFSKDSRKYISYAPSMEIKQLSFSEKMYLQEALTQFDSISVREDSVIPLLKPLTDKTIVQVCDPVLLGGVSIWKAMTKVRLIRYPYVVIYQIRETTDAMVLAERIAHQINGRVVVLTARIDKKYETKYQAASPADFVNYIYYADFVITTSFHGCAFSILFNKSFYAFKLGDNFDARSISLLKSVGLEDRMLVPGAKISISNIDFCPVNARLQEIRKASRDYLNAALTN